MWVRLGTMDCGEYGVWCTGFGVRGMEYPIRPSAEINGDVVVHTSIIDDSR